MKTKLINWFTKAESFTKEKSPAILAGLAIAGVVVTAYAAYKAGPKAGKILAAKRRDMKDCAPDDKAAKRTVMKEAVKEMIPVVAPPIIMGATTIGCIVGSHKISARRLAVVSAAYSLSESAVKDLGGKMEEMLGEKKARAVRDAIMKDKLDKAELPKMDGATPAVIIPGSYVLCRDLYTKQYFHSNAEKINRAIGQMNVDILTRDFVSLNDLFDEIDSPELERCPLGDDIGWHVKDLGVNNKLPIRLTALLTPDQQPCLCLDYDVTVTPGVLSRY